jgi:hypothetical protein
MHTEANMRTTLDLPESLMKDALKASHQRTKTTVIIAALEDFVRKSKLEGLKRFKGRVALEMDLSRLRGRRRTERTE